MGCPLGPPRMGGPMAVAADARRRGVRCVGPARFPQRTGHGDGPVGWARGRRGTQGAGEQHAHTAWKRHVGPNSQIGRDGGRAGRRPLHRQPAHHRRPNHRLPLAVTGALHERARWGGAPGPPRMGGPMAVRAGARLRSGARARTGHREGRPAPAASASGWPLLVRALAGPRYPRARGKEGGRGHRG